MSKKRVVKQSFPKDMAEILASVKKILTSSLHVDQECVIATTTNIVSDLGAEETDWMDIVWRLEKTFKIKIPKDVVKPDFIFVNQKFTSGGKVTQEGLNEIKKRMPFIDLSIFEKDPRVNKLHSLYTVQHVANCIAFRLGLKRFISALS